MNYLNRVNSKLLDLLCIQLLKGKISLSLRGPFKPASSSSHSLWEIRQRMRMGWTGDGCYDFMFFYLYHVMQCVQQDCTLFTGRHLATRIEMSQGRGPREDNMSSLESSISSYLHHYLCKEKPWLLSWHWFIKDSVVYLISPFGIGS